MSILDFLYRERFTQIANREIARRNQVLPGNIPIRVNLYYRKGKVIDLDKSLCERNKNPQLSKDVPHSFVPNMLTSSFGMLECRPRAVVCDSYVFETLHKDKSMTRLF